MTAPLANDHEFQTETVNTPRGWAAVRVTHRPTGTVAERQRSETLRSAVAAQQECVVELRRRLAGPPPAPPAGDRKPPRLAGAEYATLHELLQFQRDSFVRKVSGVDDAAARRSPVGSGTSLLWLTKHLSGAEMRWMLQRFAGADVDIPDPAPQPGDTLDGAIEVYRATWGRVDRVAEAAGLDDVCRAADAEPNVNLRWVLAHLLEETARHAGHADILRELIDGQTGR